ncbi:MAG: nitrous oxide-stimulated promoter family protein, partial [Duncaniella sp.]|nr:nitrous oxide-stimulated promoter family protein [Duncaniella sp.]
MISDEKETIAMMIRLYCRRKEHNHQLCPQCDALIRYAVTRLDYCRFGDGKPSCRL